MNNSLEQYQNIFFIGIAGAGMSALAQYLSGSGKTVSGSDRYFAANEPHKIKAQLEDCGIKCFAQNGEGISDKTDLIVASTAIEDTVYEVQKAQQLNIPILKRSELLALIVQSKKTIAIGGTSGKSSTSAMLYQILNFAGLSPGIISGAGLTGLIRQGKIGNAAVGTGEWLIIEADESDGSIVQYKPEIGVLLNVDKDHQEIEELLGLFQIFKNNAKSLFSVNQSNALARVLSANSNADFGFEEKKAGYSVENFVQSGAEIQFCIKNQPFVLQALGRHSAENVAAAVAVAHQLGVDLSVCADSLRNYEGIYRRHQILGEKNGVIVVDDYAHNPAKCAASIRACQPLGRKLIAWFQPHGYGPTRFLKQDFIDEISAAMRPDDQIWMSEIFYAGGTAVKDISAKNLICGIEAKGKDAHFVEDRADFLEAVRPSLTRDTVLLLMGARDPGLEHFSAELFNRL